MSVITDEDLEALAVSLLGRYATREQVRGSIEEREAFDASTWRHLAAAGFCGLIAPVRFGGMGADFGQLAPVLVELGARFVPVPFLSSALAVAAISAWGDPRVQQELLPALGAGERRGAIALPQPAAPDRGDAVRADRAAAGWRLEGSVRLVPDLLAADVIVVAADTATGRGLFLVEPHAAREQLARQEQRLWDPSRAAGELRLDGYVVPAERRLATGGDGCARLTDLAAFGLACDSCGVARAALEATVAYGRQREQFGRPIGSFQAWQHRASNLFIAAEAAKAAVRVARRALPDGNRAGDAVSMAKIIAGDAAVLVAGDAVQLHGAVAYSWEYDVHFLLKRARFDEAMYGSSSWHRQRLGRSLVSARTSTSGPLGAE